MYVFAPPSPADSYCVIEGVLQGLKRAVLWGVYVLMNTFQSCSGLIACRIHWNKSELMPTSK